jgi:hypothetical protein
VDRGWDVVLEREGQTLRGIRERRATKRVLLGRVLTTASVDPFFQSCSSTHSDSSSPSPSESEIKHPIVSPMI